MGIAYSPQIVTDGIVFAYDMGNSQKSWKGAPTTNFITNPLSPASWSHLRDVNFGFISDEYFTYNGPLGKNIPAYRRTVTGTDYRAVRFDTPWSAHTQGNLSLPMTGSIYGRCLNPTNNTRLNINFQGTNSSGSRVDTNTSLLVTGDWSLLSDTRTLSNNNFVSLVSFGMKYYMNGDSTPRTWEFMMPQVEQQSFATPFVNGTRSNTEAILDLTNNNTITENSLTYAADGTFSFDRLNNPTLATNLPVTALPALSNFTLSTWLNITALPPIAANNGVIFGATYYSGTAIYWRSNGSTFTINGFIRGNDAYRVTASYTLSLNTVHHIVLTNNYSAGTLNLYVNGALFSSVATATQEYVLANAAIAGNVGVNKPQVDGGGSQVYTYFTGIVHSALIYNRALTAAEVTQNFVATRGRFGI